MIDQSEIPTDEEIRIEADRIGLHPAHAKLAMVIAEELRERGCCALTREQLAELAYRSVSAIDRSLRILRKAGWLVESGSSDPPEQTTSKRIVFDRSAARLEIASFEY